MRFPSNKTLAKIAVYGAFASVSAVMYMRVSYEKRIAEQEYFKEAFRTLRGHHGAVSFLGEPIKQMGFDLSNTEKNFCDGKTAKFEVAVKGPKDKGTIYFWSHKDDEKWLIDRLELELKSHPDRRLLVKKSDAE